MKQTIQKVFALGLCAYPLSAPLYANDDWSLNNQVTIYADFVYMRRNALGENHVLIQEVACPFVPPPCVCPPCPVVVPPPPIRTRLATRELIRRSKFEPGYRVGMWITPTECQSVEASYMRVDEWHAKVSRCGDCCNLQFPFCPISCVCNFVHANSASACFNSHFQTFEANYWQHVTPRRCHYFSYSWLAGFRYFRLNEKMLIAFERGGSVSNYNISTGNNLYGAQVGVNLQINPYRIVSWDFTLKGGILANFGKQRTFLGDFGNEVILRNYERMETAAAYMGDGNVTLTLQLARYVNFHVGYEGIYIANLVLPAGQIDDRFNDDKCCLSREVIKTSGRVYIQGVFAGLGLSF